MCQGEAPVIIFHQVAFAADYQRSEFSLLGMAIKYAMILVLTLQRARSVGSLPQNWKTQLLLRAQNQV